MKAKAGNRLFRPTQEQRLRVTAMAASGIKIEAVARATGISQPTLRKHFSDELETAATIANTKVAERLLDVACNGTGKESITAMIFWLKCRAGWREFQPVPGKREIAEQVARTAAVGTEWGDDLATPAGPLN